MPDNAASEAAVTDIEAFEQALTARRDSLPKRLRQCAEFVARHPDRLAFGTVSEIAAAAGVQPSALIRFCQVMGFSGYSELQRLFRTRFTAPYPDYQTRIRRLRDSGGTTPEALLAEFADAGRQSLARLTDQVAPASLHAAARTLATAPMVHVIGLRRAVAVAAYLVYALEKLDRPAMLHGAAGMVTQPAAIRPQDAVVAISFSPYSPETVAAVAAARAAGATVVAITDSRRSPLFDLGDTILEIAEVDVGAFRSFSATFALVAALAVSAGMLRPGWARIGPGSGRGPEEWNCNPAAME